MSRLLTACASRLSMDCAAWRRSPASLIVMAAVGIPLSLLCAAVFFQVFERPFLNVSRPAQAPPAPDLALADARYGGREYAPAAQQRRTG
jgi:hypothetical protein